MKDMQQRGKLLIELREEKQKMEYMKVQENSKCQQLSQTELQATIDSYETQVAEL